MKGKKNSTSEDTKREETQILLPEEKIKVKK